MKLNGYNTAPARAQARYCEGRGPLTPDEKKVCASHQEVFAAFAEATDCKIGRVWQAIDDMGVLENTLIVMSARAAHPVRSAV